MEGGGCWFFFGVYVMLCYCLSIYLSTGRVWDSIRGSVVEYFFFAFFGLFFLDSKHRYCKYQGSEWDKGEVQSPLSTIMHVD